MLVVTRSLAAALASVLCFEAHVEFTKRPRVAMSLNYVLTDEVGTTLAPDKGWDISPAADPNSLAKVVAGQMAEFNWQATCARGTPVVVVRGSDKAGIKSVEFKSTTGWTPEVKMVPVLRAPPPKADDKK